MFNIISYNPSRTLFLKSRCMYLTRYLNVRVSLFTYFLVPWGRVEFRDLWSYFHLKRLSQVRSLPQIGRLSLGLLARLVQQNNKAFVLEQCKNLHRIPPSHKEQFCLSCTHMTPCMHELFEVKEEEPT